MSPMRPGGPSTEVRILLLGRTRADLPSRPPWDAASARWPWEAWCGEDVGRLSSGDDRGRPVHRVRVDRTVHGRQVLRRWVSLARTTGRAAAARAPLGWVRALHGSRELRAAARAADVLWSVDRRTDAALRAVPRLAGDTVVLTSESWSSAQSVLAALDEVLAAMAAPPEPDGDRGEIAPDSLDLWADRLAGLEVSRLPAVLRAEDAAAEATRTHQWHHGLIAGARAATALASPGWRPAERGASGLAARQAGAELSLGTLAWEDVDELALSELAEAAVRGADQALGGGDEPAALARLGDAMALLFNRARHAEVPRSALADDPESFLAPLRSSRTLAVLRGPGAEPGSSQASRLETRDRPTRVLVVTGAYGDFHRGVVTALRGHADVKIRDFTRKYPALGRKVMDPWILPALATLVGRSDGRKVAWADPELAADVEEISRGLLPMVRWADVIFTDWADRATVWVSHLCPPDVRLVLRVHALDALDPWLHLVRWDRIEQVVVVSEPMRSLVVDLLAALGVHVPVHVVRHAVTQLPDLARNKHAVARTTLGMIGWGRRVKDPLWAMDLLERDPSWQLVLIGPDFHDDPAPVAGPYARQVHARMESPSLRGRVHVVGPTDDVGEPLRRVGVILSTSVRESWHLGLVEGAASGAVPVVRDWPLLAARGGPRTLFPAEWVVDDLDEAEARVRRVTDPEVWAAESARAREQALALFHPEEVAADYRALVLRGRPPGAGEDD